MPKSNRRNGRRVFSPLEEAQLRRLTGQAFDLKGSGYLVDATEAISEWQAVTWPDRLERLVERKA